MGDDPLGVSESALYDRDRSQAAFDSAIHASSEATASALKGCDIDYVCMPISVASLATFGGIRYGVNDARRLGRVADIGKLVRGTGRPRPAVGTNPWVVVATTPMFIYADLSVASAGVTSDGFDDSAAELEREAAAGSVRADVSSGAAAALHRTAVGSGRHAAHDGRGQLLEALALQGGNTFVPHSSNTYVHRTSDHGV
jgi:hypothetical protein